MQILAYNFKLKSSVPMLDAIITKTARGAYLAQGHDGNGNKLSKLLSKEIALKAIESGHATKGWED